MSLRHRWNRRRIKHRNARANPPVVEVVVILAAAVAAASVIVLMIRP